MISIINCSSVVSDVQGSFIVQGLNMILPKFCNDWNLPLYTAVYVPKGKTSTIVKKVFLLDTSDIQSALGYHDLSSNIPYGKCFAKTLLDDGGTILYSSNSLIPTFAQTVSHEVFELLVDPLCNSWWDIGDGQTLFASETCDPVESNVVVANVLVTPAKTTYNVITKKNVVSIPAVYQLVGLSDWILPAWSDPQATKGPFNHLNTLKAPFTLDKGGYGIQLIGGQFKQVTAMIFGSEVTPQQKAKYSTKKRVLKRENEFFKL